MTADQAKSEGALRAQKARIRAQMKDLPKDVQASIEKYCSETTGKRASSHSRQTMTERALAYQAKMGKATAKGMTTTVTDTSKPGDPAYGPTGNQVCVCGKDTGHRLVVKCLACCTRGDGFSERVA